MCVCVCACEFESFHPLIFSAMCAFFDALTRNCTHGVYASHFYILYFRSFSSYRRKRRTEYSYQVLFVKPYSVFLEETNTQKCTTHET